jgi:hypothetical protein
LGQPDHLRSDRAEEEITEASKTGRAHYDLIGADLAPDAHDGLGRGADLRIRHEGCLRFAAEADRFAQRDPGLACR